ncbi:MAG: DUF3786 domain-containing protein [Promethearchaeota archaeon]
MADDILEYWMAEARELASRFNVEEFDKSSAFWNWDNFGKEIVKLKKVLNLGEEYLDILGLRVDFETGKTEDLLTGKEFQTSRLLPHLYYYTKAKDVGVAGEWSKYNALQGSWACRYSYDEEDIKALTTVFLEKREQLFDTLERLGAKRVDHGDAGFELEFLPKVKVLIIFEDEDDEFPASVRLLYDKNSIYYQPHEMLGEISWFLASRVFKALA